jgi:hypothetical protein
VRRHEGCGPERRSLRNDARVNHPPPCRSLRREHPERRSDHAGHGLIPHVGALPNAFQCAACFALSKSKSAQGAERLVVHGSQRSIHLTPVTSTVRVPKGEPRRHAPFDEQAPAVQGPMVRPAKNDETVVIVIAAFARGFRW